MSDKKNNVCESKKRKLFHCSHSDKVIEYVENNVEDDVFVTCRVLTVILSESEFLVILLDHGNERVGTHFPKDHSSEEHPILYPQLPLNGRMHFGEITYKNFETHLSDVSHHLIHNREKLIDKELELPVSYGFHLAGASCKTCSFKIGFVTSRSDLEKMLSGLKQLYSLYPFAKDLRRKVKLEFFEHKVESLNDHLVFRLLYQLHLVVQTPCLSCGGIFN